MIIGHEQNIKDLERLAGNGGLSHGYIFYGPSMVGKRTTALALAHFLEKGTFEPPTAGEILQDAVVIDSEKKDSIGIDAVREIKNFLWQRPNASSRRTLIIDNAELLTTEAQNALLKITEEPPTSSLLLLITSDKESIMGTIHSRLQRVYFGTVSETVIARWLGGVEMTNNEKTSKTAKTAAKAGAKTGASADAAKRALGKPGLAYKLLYDEEFNELLATAVKFLKTTPAGRRDFIKKLMEPDDFSLRNFLELVIITLAWERPSKAKAALWHKTLELYGNVNNFSLNPRLQLENLLIAP